MNCDVALGPASDAQQVAFVGAITSGLTVTRCSRALARPWAVAEPHLVRLFVAPLEALGIPYLVTGGMAAVIYGEPRFTRDVDILLDLSAADAPRLPCARTSMWQATTRFTHGRSSGADRSPSKACRSRWPRSST